jgi:hypothetical protein
MNTNWLASWQIYQGTKEEVDNVEKIYIFKYIDHKNMQRYTYKKKRICKDMDCYSVQ